MRLGQPPLHLLGAQFERDRKALACKEKRATRALPAAYCPLANYPSRPTLLFVKHGSSLPADLCAIHELAETKRCTPPDFRHPEAVFCGVCQFNDLVYIRINHCQGPSKGFEEQANSGATRTD